MKEGAARLTPLAGRVALRKKDAITGSVFLAILITIFAAIAVRVLVAACQPSDAAAFWARAALVLVADAAVCVLPFTRAF